MKMYRQADFSWRIFDRGVFPSAKLYVAEIDDYVWNLLQHETNVSEPDRKILFVSFYFIN